MFIKTNIGNLLNMDEIKVVDSTTLNLGVKDYSIFAVMKDDTQYTIAYCSNNNVIQFKNALADAIKNDEKLFDAPQWLSENKKSDSVWRRERVREGNKEKDAVEYETPFCGVQKVASIAEAAAVVNALCDLCPKTDCSKDNRDCNAIKERIWMEWVYPQYELA